MEWGQANLNQPNLHLVIRAFLNWPYYRKGTVRYHLSNNQFLETKGIASKYHFAKQGYVCAKKYWIGYSFQHGKLARKGPFHANWEFAAHTIPNLVRQKFTPYICTSLVLEGSQDSSESLQINQRNNNNNEHTTIKLQHVWRRSPSHWQGEPPSQQEEGWCYLPHWWGLWVVVGAAHWQEHKAFNPPHGKKSELWNMTLADFNATCTDNDDIGDYRTLAK